MEGELSCENSGRCTAAAGASGITNCIYCGKELIEKDGEWFTWDADFSKSPIPQWRESAAIGDN